MIYRSPLSFASRCFQRFADRSVSDLLPTFTISFRNDLPFVAFPPPPATAPDNGDRGRWLLLCHASFFHNKLRFDLDGHGISFLSSQMIDRILLSCLHYSMQGVKKSISRPSADGPFCRSFMFLLTGPHLPDQAGKRLWHASTRASL